MPGVYRPRHPERTILYRVLFHYFDRFMVEYEDRFQREYGYLRPIIKEVVERYLDCGNPKCGFARIRCPACGEERLLCFSCRTRGKLVIIEEEVQRVPRRGWAEMNRKVYEVDPLLCPECGGKMRIIAFITEFSVVDRIISQLKLTFVADKPPPPQTAYQELLIAAEASAEYFL